MTDDTELMAALFVNGTGELRVEPDWIESGKPESGWWQPHLEAAVAAGILRLIRERDEAREDALETLRERNAARAQLSWEEGVGRQLTRQLDEARQKAADWEQTARELTARVKP